MSLVALLLVAAPGVYYLVFQDTKKDDPALEEYLRRQEIGYAYTYTKSLGAIVNLYNDEYGYHATLDLDNGIRKSMTLDRVTFSVLGIHDKVVVKTKWGKLKDDTTSDLGAEWRSDIIRLESTEGKDVLEDESIKFLY